MKIKDFLLAGGSLCTLCAGSAFADTAPKFHVSAMRPGHAVMKTPMHKSPVGHLTYTFSVYTGVSTASAYHMKTPLPATYYKWNSSYSICTAPKIRNRLATKKTKYADLRTGQQSYSLGCPNGPTKFYGDQYNLQTKQAVGKTDTFTSTLTGHFMSGGTAYKGVLTLDVSVAIGS
jgi:hypothetical protein